MGVQLQTDDSGESFFEVTCDNGKLGFTYGGNRNIVNEVKPNSWAEGAGVLAGDVLASMNGRECADLNMASKHSLMKSERPITFKFVRGRVMPPRGSPTASRPGTADSVAGQVVGSEQGSARGEQGSTPEETLFEAECKEGKLGFTYGGNRNRVNEVKPNSW